MAALALIPGGDVELYDARRRTQRTVTVRSFHAGIHAVTQAEFAAARVADLHERLGDERPVTAVRWIDAIRWCGAASVADGLTPAYTETAGAVHWNPAADGYRLPTEAEWVHASRGGIPAARYGPLAEIAWTAGDHVTGPQPVGRKQPNAYGLFDTLGNTWEWCWDRLDPARYGDYRVFKGGGWSDPTWSCRVGVRRGNAPNATVEDVGFRVFQGPVARSGGDGGQGWSEAADRRRASSRGPLPVGWTPLRPESTE